MSLELNTAAENLVLFFSASAPAFFNAPEKLEDLHVKDIITQALTDWIELLKLGFRVDLSSHCLISPLLKDIFKKSSHNHLYFQPTTSYIQTITVEDATNYCKNVVGNPVLDKLAQSIEKSQDVFSFEKFLPLWAKFNPTMTNVFSLNTITAFNSGKKASHSCFVCSKCVLPTNVRCDYVNHMNQLELTCSFLQSLGVYKQRKSKTFTKHSPSTEKCVIFCAPDSTELGFDFTIPADVSFPISHLNIPLYTLSTMLRMNQVRFDSYDLTNPTKLDKIDISSKMNEIIQHYQSGNWEGKSLCSFMEHELRNFIDTPQATDDKFQCVIYYYFMLSNLILSTVDFYLSV